MNLVSKNGCFSITSSGYNLSFDKSNPYYINLDFNNGLGGNLFAASGCDKDEWIDSLVSLELPLVKEKSDSIEISFAGRTTCWDEVVYCFECLEDRVIYYYTVKGKGSIENARFFEGFLDEDPRMEDAFYPYFQGAHRSMSYKRPWKYFASSSSPKFEKVYSFSINSSDTREKMYYENYTLRVNGDRTNLGGDWLVTPPPYIYLLNNKEQTNYISMSLLVNKGENNFCEYQYIGGEGFGLNLTYDGYVKVDGSWTSPGLMLTQHDTTDPYKALEDYVAYLRDNDYVNKKDRSNKPRWWHEPIFGGWGEQMYMSDYFKTYKMKEVPEGCGFAGPTHCTRKAYDSITLDTASSKLAVNPLNKEYQQYLAEKIHYLISPDGLDADGFEFDYTHWLWSNGSPRGLKVDQWGAEILHTLTKIYHDQAKKAKSDALIITHTYNPYFDDCIDMLRLQDIYTDRKEVNGQFAHRAKLVSIVCPDCCVHTDQHPMPSLHAWRTYMPFQPEIGNPCLYYITGIETTYEKFEDCDWQMLREVWDRYDRKLTERFGPKQ